MLNFKDDGKFVELSFYVPAYNPRAIPQERFRLTSGLTYHALFKELHAYKQVYSFCPVINYEIVLDDYFYNQSLRKSFVNTDSFGRFFEGVICPPDISIKSPSEVNVLKCYIQLLKPLEFQHQPAQKKKTKRKYRKRTGIPRGIRNEVFKRDNYTCVQCGAKKGDKKPDGSTVSLHIDHKKPLAKGGTDEMSNLQTLCKDCNLNKNDVYQLVGEVNNDRK